MPRIRTIKPSFFQSEDVSALPLRARLTWVGLWTHCDDAGRAKDNQKLIKAAVWPLDDVSLADIEADLDELAARGRIVRYESGGKRYLAITNWGEHQSISRATESKLPAPPSNNGQQSGTRPREPSDDHDSTHGGLSEDSESTQFRKGREGKGREGARAPARDDEPPTRCPKHATVDNPPNCGQCKEAREANQRWHEQRKTQTHSCSLCDADGYRLEPGRRIVKTPYERCTHQETE